MVPITSLVLAIVISAVLVWIVSAIVWMVLPWHKTDFSAVPNEDAARDALKGLAPGQYDLPHATSPEDLKDEAMAARFRDGPVGFITIKESGIPNMVPSLVKTIVFYLVVGLVVAYVTTRTLPAGADYLKVFQIAGTTAWVAHSFGVIPDAIWFGRPWSNVAKALLDGFIYGLLTGGVFGWLWPDIVIATAG